MFKSIGQSIEKNKLPAKKDGNSRLFNVRLVRAIKP
jgi:hypothetical protein